MGNAVRDGIDHTETFAKDLKGEIKTKVEDYASSMKNKTENFIKDGNLEDYSARAKHLLDEGVKGASQLYSTSVEKLERTIKARPLVSLAVAFVAGFATVALTRFLMNKEGSGIVSKDPLI